MMLQHAIQRFIVNELMYEDGVTSIEPDFPLVDNHIIDSLGLLRLIIFIEDQFGIEVRDEEVIPGNFKTINDVQAFIQRKQMT